MTIPWLMNCPHSDDSWCIPCVAKLGDERVDLLAALKRMLDEFGDTTTFSPTREREAIEQAQAAIARAEK